MKEPQRAEPAVPVARAILYGHQEVGLPDCTEITELEVDRLWVGRVAGRSRVIISASGDPRDCYGIELELDAEPARELARRLALVADNDGPPA